MYGVASTGGLTRGPCRPYFRLDRLFTDEEWYVSLWKSLACDVGHARCDAVRCHHPNIEALERFEAFCHNTVSLLLSEYNLEDSDAL
jgi:hypothetical protein